MKMSRGSGNIQNMRARQVGDALLGPEPLLEQRVLQHQDLHHAAAPAGALADEGDEILRLQAGDQRLVDVEAVPAARMQLERGLAILGDGDAGKAAGLCSAPCGAAPPPSRRRRRRSTCRAPSGSSSRTSRSRTACARRSRGSSRSGRGSGRNAASARGRASAIVGEMADRLAQEVSRRPVVGVEDGDQVAASNAAGRY